MSAPTILVVGPDAAEVSAMAARLRAAGYGVTTEADAASPWTIDRVCRVGIVAPGWKECVAWARGCPSFDGSAPCGT